MNNNQCNTCCYGPEIADVLVRNCGTDCDPNKEQSVIAQVTAKVTVTTSDKPYALKTANLRWHPTCGGAPPVTSEVLYDGKWWTVTEVYDASPFRVRVTITRATLEGCAVELADIWSNDAVLEPRGHYFQKPQYKGVKVALVHAETLERLEDQQRIWEGTWQVFMEHETAHLVDRESLFRIQGKLYRVDRLLDVDHWDRLPVAVVSKTHTGVMAAA